MLKMVKLSEEFWAEVVDTACYLINRSPSVPLGFDIPEKVWSGKNISYSHLRVFSCLAYVHVPKEKRTKLDYKPTPGIFVGYGNENFEYRIWDPERRKIMRSRDVISRELETFEASSTNEEASKVSTGHVDLSSSHALLETITSDDEASNSDHELFDMPILDEVQSGTHKTTTVDGVEEQGE